jgi:hypothetical protein
MTLSFDFRNTATTEFGVGRENSSGQSFVMVPIDAGVQAALQEMVAATRTEMGASVQDAAPLYEPSEKYGSVEYVRLPLNDDLGAQIRSIHQANNLPSDAGALSEAGDVFCYFVRMTDGEGKRLTGLRRANQFKGILKSRLLHFLSDALRIVEDKVFKLDNDFDLLVDDTEIHILRPSGFEFVGKMQDAVLAAVPANIEQIQQDLPFVDFSSIATYAGTHPRAARHLASIRTLNETQNIDRNLLKKLCKRTGVVIHEAEGKVVIDSGSEMGFLEVLDRRRYHLELVKDSSEYFKAASRRKIGSVATNIQATSPGTGRQR